jgi:hypothetical protein
MAEWFKRGTVNTFYRGSNPLKTLKLNSNFINRKTNKQINKQHKFLIYFNYLIKNKIP